MRQDTASAAPRATDPAHLHAHRAGDARHQHYTRGRSLKVLGWALSLTLGFACVEVAAGFMANSLALISDAGHMATDAASLGLALLAQLISKRPPSARYSFGFGRAEALAAFVNGLAMLAVVAWIVFEAAQRFAAPPQVRGGTVFVVAGIGLAINLAVAWVLSHDKESMNTRAALVHVLGDLLGSIAALIAGAVIWYTGWMRIDPLLSVLVSLLILKSTFGILKESYHHLMEGVPEQIDYVKVGAELEAIAGVLSVHDLHVWAMSPGQPALIGHVEIADLQQWPAILAAIKAMLLARHGIDHVTLQPEAAGQPAHG
ncbi:cation diffusion facilitator family transporter [Pseudoduganella namucuonensis]|uniref:Cobalt-zinc-cadmium efflux system protein n=1 Tax=Pseudoduganella namucuonensis TaxID=1035707 RepID=A0A1I7HSJ4_9BURK|nr:cation diffusion facilitator family transporter [Pseudoduganella namucuonensis]SFU63647.1 cobalt-zinc-cadmium efflux system protein [Pseudoduganella namucuonensis]